MSIAKSQLYRPPGSPHLALLIIVPGDGENLARISFAYRVIGHGDKVDACVAIYVILRVLPFFLISEDEFESEIVFDECVSRILSVKWVFYHYGLIRPDALQIIVGRLPHEQVREVEDKAPAFFTMHLDLLVHKVLV